MLTARQLVFFIQRQNKEKSGSIASNNTVYCFNEKVKSAQLTFPKSKKQMCSQPIMSIVQTETKIKRSYAEKKDQKNTN